MMLLKLSLFSLVLGASAIGSHLKRKKVRDIIGSINRNSGGY